MQSLATITSQPHASWPDALRPVFERSITCEYATVTARGMPITYPLTPYIGVNGNTLDVSTGLAYPAKADRARRNPKVALLYSDPIGTGLSSPPVVLVHGYAAVRDADLQSNTDRYVRLSLAKVPAAFRGTPQFALRGMAWYFARIWIEVTPARMLWWPDGRLDRQPQRWEAPDSAMPSSDSAPAGKAPAAWKDAPSDWRASAAYAVQQLGDPILTVVGGDGFPTPMRVKAAIASDGFRVDVPNGTAAEVAGPACLTFHSHPEEFTGQQNMVFVGQVRRDASSYAIAVERQLGDWSLNGSKMQIMWNFLGNARKLKPRLEAEARRRGQPVPKVRLPGQR